MEGFSYLYLPAADPPIFFFFNEAGGREGGRQVGREAGVRYIIFSVSVF